MADTTTLPYACQYTRVPNHILKDSSLSAYAKLVLVVLLSHDWTGAGAFPSLQLIADEASISKSSAQRSLNELQLKGYITKVGPGRLRTMIYRQGGQPDHVSWSVGPPWVVTRTTEERLIENDSENNTPVVPKPGPGEIDSMSRLVSEVRRTPQPDKSAPKPRDVATQKRIEVAATYLGARTFIEPTLHPKDRNAWKWLINKHGMDELQQVIDNCVEKYVRTAEYPHITVQTVAYWSRFKFVKGESKHAQRLQALNKQLSAARDYAQLVRRVALYQVRRSDILPGTLDADTLDRLLTEGRLRPDDEPSGDTAAVPQSQSV